jgi:lipopolysaccharide/colanic/teichoic acid biosynthesis glycosyltransferase
MPPLTAIFEEPGAPASSIDPATLHSSSAPRTHRYWWLPPYAMWKHLIDRVLAAIILVCVTPLILLLATLIKLADGGPSFYSQIRLGRHGRPYRIYKLRTMTLNCEDESGPIWSCRNDARVTRLGRLLRLTHLDELPQLHNIIRGEMSLIGPRPERPELIQRLEPAIWDYRKRLDVRPGLTGLAQVRLEADTSIEHVRRKVRYDLYYIRRMSLALDLRILAATVVYLILVSFTALRDVCSATRFPASDESQ